MIYQKMSQNAIAAVSRLAEIYHDPECRLSSRDIAESRNLPVPLAGKILTVLARHGLVVGAPGPGGGYRLALPPEEISLGDVVALFEREAGAACPYGPGWCGNGDPCPLHESMMAMQHVIQEYLEQTTFAVFAKDAQRSKRQAQRKKSQRGSKRK